MPYLPPRRLRASLRASTLDGVLHAAMVGFGETFFAAFALSLGATPLQVGVLATAPILFGSIFQITAPALSRRIGDKPWVVASATFQALTFAPIILIGALAGPLWYPLLLVWVCLYWAAALGLSPAWNAWMGRLVPEHIRSRFFGRRNVPVQITLFLSVLGAGFVIESGTSFGAAVGFGGAFALAALARLGSAWFLSRQDDLPVHHEGPQLSLREAAAGIPTDPYGRLVLLLVAMSAAVHVSAAYFTPFMLVELRLSYVRFTILTATIVVARILSSPYWGEIARTYGNRRALQVAALLVVPLPGLWLVSDSYAYLLFLQLFAGFAWAGYELTLFLNLLDCTTDRNRAQVLTLFNLLNGFGIVAGSLVGGFLLHRGGLEGYLAIFLVSSVFRAAALLAFARGVGRRRPAVEHSFRDVFLRVLTLRPGLGPDDRPVVLPSRRGR